MFLTSEYQFVYPDPKGSELIVSAPFRAGVIRENQFANWVNKRIFINLIRKSFLIQKQ